MPKTYTALTVANATAGNAILASDFSSLFTNSNNYRVPPSARVNLTSAVSVANNSHTDFVGFTSTNATEDHDTDDMVTLSGTASAITIQTAGIYAVSGQAVWTANATGVRIARILRSRSGTLTAINTIIQNGNIGSPSNVLLPVSGIITCNAGDLIRLMVYQSSGGALNLLDVDASDAQYGRTHIAATWIGQAS